MSPAVNAAERRRDRIALGFLVVGAFLYGAAFLGMHAMAVVPIIPVPGHPAVEHFTRLWVMSIVGLSLIGVGGVAMLWSFGRFYARRQAAP